MAGAAADTSPPGARPEPAGGGAAWALVPVALCLLPFLGKAFAFDDPFYLWIAGHLREHPLDFYGLRINWYGTLAPLAEVNKNPPLVSYFILAAGALVGTGEVGLHLAFLLPALGAVLGTYRLAQELCGAPREAALLAALTPVFLVSSTTVMCDVLMLCSWVWAVTLWRRGLVERRQLWLGLAAGLVAAAVLTKYIGGALVPLLFAYAVLRERRPGAWLLWLLVPLGAMAGYQALTAALYGRGLLLDAAAYASAETLRAGSGGLARLATGLAFTGGCYCSLLFVAPRLGRGRGLLLGASGGAALALVAAVLAQGSLGVTPLADAGGVRWTLLLQLALFTWAGLLLLGLCAQDLLERRDADSALLGLWVLGIFAFSTFFNWTTNARSLLPMMPAVGILALRRARSAPPVAGWRRGLAEWPLLASAAVALLAAQADATQANCAREAAATLGGLRRPGVATWFQGHWGFQYYAERAGLQAFDFKETSLQVGDRLIVPRANTNVRPLPDGTYAVEQVLDLASSAWAATMDRSLGAGFYTDRMGALPFVLGHPAPDRYTVLSIKVPLVRARPPAAPAPPAPR